MEILNVKQVAEITGFSKSFIYQFFQELGGKKIGGKIFFRQDQLEDALKNDGTQTKGKKNLELRIPISRSKAQSRRIRKQDGSTRGRAPSPQDIKAAIKRHELN